MVFKILRLTLFILSMTGYVFYTERKTKIQVEFLPIITIAFHTAVLFIAGILNFLPLATSALFITGLFLFFTEIYSAYKEKMMFKKLGRYLTPGIILFLIMGVYFSLLLSGQRLVYRDDYSHWVLVIKNLIMEDRFPNSSSIYISHNSYPKGSALFIYYFSKIAGSSEGMALIGQMMMMLSGVLTLFSFPSFSPLNIKEIKDQLIGKLMMTLLAMVIGLELLTGPYSIHGLLVDHALVICGVALFSLIYYYFDSPDKIFIPVTVLSILVVQIKNAGLAFVIFGLAVYIASLIKDKKKLNLSFSQYVKEKVYLFIPVFAPFVTTFIWTKHLALVYGEDDLGRHSMTLSHYLTTFNEKTSEEIREITSIFFDAVFEVEANQVFTLIGVLLFMAAIYHLINKKANNRLLTTAIATFLVFFFYAIGLWLIYLISMSTTEGLRLASYPRYMLTIMDYLIGITGVALLYVLSTSKNTTLSAILASIVFLYFGSIIFGEDKMEETEAIFQQREMELNIANIEASYTHISSNPMESVSRAESHIIYFPIGRTSDTNWYYSVYRLYNDEVQFFKNFEVDINIWDYEALSITEVTDEMEEFFKEYSNVHPKIGTYRLDQENKRIYEISSINNK